MANIAISDLQTQAESFNSEDLLLISKSSKDNNTYTSAKIKASCLIDLIDSKIQTLANSLSNLREVISNVTSSTEEYSVLDYCKLDGNLGILGSDISNYDSIIKYEIKFEISSMLTYTNDMFFYHIIDTGSFSYEDQFYNWGQYRDNNTKSKKYKFVLYSDNDRSSGRSKLILHTTTTVGGTLSSPNKYAIDGLRIDCSDDQPHIISFIKTGKVQCDGVDVCGAGSGFNNNNVNLQDWTTDKIDTIISGYDYTHGLVGKLYYIKGYNTSNELVANLTPRSKLNYVYLHDSITDTNVDFRGSGSATAPLQN